MRLLFRDTAGRLRNGWWILLFLALVAATSLLYTPVSRALQAAGAGPAMLDVLPVVFLLAVTWACVRARGEGLASVGLRPDLPWWRQAAAGVAVGAGLMLAITAVIAACGGVRFAPDPDRTLALFAAGTWMYLWAAILEELLFRGFVFQRLLDGIGVWPAQLLLAALFALAHQANPDMHGPLRIWASIDIALGAVLLGLAYLRTRRLALPIGIHLGWNWMQGTALGFDVSGTDTHGWLLPTLGARPDWLTGGTFGPEASAVAVIVDLLAIAWLWRWKGLPPPATAARPPG